jgi:flagella basal body P-ring formation protein FlgA
MRSQLFTKIKKLCLHQGVTFPFLGCLLLTLVFLASSNAQEALPHTDLDTLLEQAEKFITNQSELPEGKPTLSAPDSRIEIPECNTGFEFSFPFTSKTSLKASCSRKDWTLFLQVSYESIDSVAIFSKDLEAGSLLTDSDLTNGDTLDIEWEGRFIKTSVRSGQRFNEALLDNVVLVFKLTQDVGKGDLITRSMYEQESLPASQFQNKLHDNNKVLNAKAVRALSAGHRLDRNDVLPKKRVLEVKSPVSRGTPVKEDMVHLTDFWGRVPTDALIDLNQLPYAVATSQLIPGQALRLSQLRIIPAIQKGQVVKVSVERGQINISTQMIAESSAEIGQRIRLRNEDSGQVVEGIVTAIGFATLP